MSDEKRFDLVAILGRGIQRDSPNGVWALTEDLEVCDERSGHLPVRIPADDNNPLCLVGGGEMNLLAGLGLIFQHEPAVVVCAYGARSSYLKSISAPSESEVMSQEVAREAFRKPGFLSGSNARYSPDVVVWERNRECSASNTRQELLNVFDLALERRLKRLAIVTVGVHVPRTATYVAKHLSVYEKYWALSPVVLESEEVLLAANREQYGPRVKALRDSKSFARNWGGKDREADGISKIVRDVYGDAKPVVTT